MKTTPTVVTLAMLLNCSPLAALAADVEIKDPWVRGTVSGQQATGAFMAITSKSGAVLVASQGRCWSVLPARQPATPKSTK